MIRHSLRHSLKPLVSAVLLALLVAAGGAGCSQDAGRARSTRAVGGLKDTRDELASARKQVDETLAAVDGLQNARGDLRPAYDAYKKEVQEMEAGARSVSDRAADMRARADEYQKKWQQEMSVVTDPGLRAAAESRAAKVRGRYASITAKGQDVKAAYEPFIRDLKDVQTYLSNDLTPAAIQAAGPAFAKAKSDGRTLQQRLDALTAELDAVTAELSPGTPPQ